MQSITMETPKFGLQRLNFNRQWRAVVEQRGETVDAVRLMEKLQRHCPLDRQTTQRLFDALRIVLTDELAAGNTVCLFDVVRLTPRFRLRDPVCGTREQVADRLRGLTAKDVRMEVGANATTRLTALCRLRHGRR